jgi:hypothetical protein
VLIYRSHFFANPVYGTVVCYHVFKGVEDPSKVIKHVSPHDIHVYEVNASTHKPCSVVSIKFNAFLTARNMIANHCTVYRVGKKVGNTHISQDDGKYWYLPGNTGK